MTEEEKQKHIKAAEIKQNNEAWHLPHPIWTEKEVKDVKITHLTPSTFGD
jgi:hypothetical protein